MTATVAVRLRSAWVGARVAPDTIALGGLLVLAVAFLALGWGTWGDLDVDTGYDVVAGARVADGELPYADFVYYYGPLAPILAGLASVLGGPGFGPAVGLGLGIALAIIFATYGLARVLLPPIGAFLAAVITAAVAFIPDNNSYVLPHTFAATLGTLLVLGVLLLLWRYADTLRVGWLVAAGTCLGLVGLTKPEPTVAAFGAVIVWLALRACTGARWQREAVWVGVPGLLVPAAVYGSFLAVVSPHRLLLENLFPVETLEAGGDAVINVRLPLTVESVFVLGGRLALYAVGCALLLLVARGLRGPARLRRVLLVASVLAAMLAVIAFLVNPEAVRHGLQFAWGWVPAGAALAVGVLLVRFRWRKGAWSATAQLELAGMVALTVLAASVYGAFFLNAPNTQQAIYYVPLAAIFLVRLHLRELAPHRHAFALGLAWVTFLAAASTGLTLKDARAESVTVEGPGGALAEKPAEGALYRAALSTIAERTSPGEPILLAPFLTGLYVLSARESPLPELTMLPSVLPDVQAEREAIARLQDADVRLVITDRRTFPEYGHTSFGQSFHRTLAAWINQRFDRIGTLEGTEGRTLDVFFRRGS